MLFFRAWFEARLRDAFRNCRRGFVALAVSFLMIAFTAVADVQSSAFGQDWNVDSVQFGRNWQDSLVGQFLNTETVLPLPWGGTAFGVRGMTQQNLLGVWIQDAQGVWSHPFIPVPTGVSRSVAALALAEDEDGSIIMLAGTDNGPYASADSGRTWQPRNGLTIRQLDDGERSWWSEIDDLLDEGEGRWWAVSAFDGPAFSDNYGTSWQLITAGLRGRNIPNVFNTGLIYQGSDGQIWLQGEDAMYLLDRQDMRDSRTWQWVPMVDGIEYNLVDGNHYCVPVLATFPDGKCDDGHGRMYLWSGWGLIWRSDDSGESWEQITDGNDEWPFTGSLTFVPTIVVNESGLVLFGTDSGGLFVSEDNGDNWLPVGGRHPDYPDDEVASHYRWWHDWIGGIFDLAFDSDGHLLIGTWDGALRSSIPMNGNIEHPNVVLNPVIQPETFLLSAYPNPFNGILRVSIDAGNQPFSLSIYDNSGRLMKNWSDRGSRSLIWETADIPAGQYFVRVNSLEKASSAMVPVTLVK